MNLEQLLKLGLLSLGTPQIYTWRPKGVKETFLKIQYTVTLPILLFSYQISKAQTCKMFMLQGRAPTPHKNLFSLPQLF
jgi:hypothetical protein